MKFIPYFENNKNNQTKCLFSLNIITLPEIASKRSGSKSSRWCTCSYIFRNIHKQIPVSKSLFNKVAELRPSTLLK